MHFYVHRQRQRRNITDQFKALNEVQTLYFLDTTLRLYRNTYGPEVYIRCYHNQQTLSHRLTLQFLFAL